MYSVAINKLLAAAEAHGLQVLVRSPEIGDSVIGQIDYAAQTIKINTPSAELACVALAHELGHWAWFTRQRLPAEEVEVRTTSAARERRAYLYGWAILCKLAPGTVTRAVWRRWHAAEKGCTLEDTTPTVGWWSTFCCVRDLSRISTEEELQDYLEQTTEFQATGMGMGYRFWPDEASALRALREDEDADMQVRIDARLECVSAGVGVPWDE